jgi:hypothetical protein
MSVRRFVSALTFAAAVSWANAQPIEPISYGTTTDADSVQFSFTFDRPFDLAANDLFQVWAVDGYDLYNETLNRIPLGQPISLESEVAVARLFSPAADPVSVVSFREVAFGLNKAEIVSVTPFAPGTQENGANDRGGWGAVQGYQDFSIVGNTLMIDVPFALLGVGPSFTYFFKTYEGGEGGVTEWLGRSNAEYTTPFAIPVPEPSTYAMMAIGLIALGFAGYRNRAAR